MSRLSHEGVPSALLKIAPPVFFPFAAWLTSVAPSRWDLEVITHPVMCPPTLPGNQSVFLFPQELIHVMVPVPMTLCCNLSFSMFVPSGALRAGSCSCGVLSTLSSSLCRLSHADQLISLKSRFQDSYDRKVILSCWRFIPHYIVFS